MHQNLQANLFTNSKQTHMGGLAVRTGLRGGACVDVNDEVKSALQTLTNALGGTTTTVTPATTTTATAPTSS